jgi:hypothetical protein
MRVGNSNNLFSPKLLESYFNPKTIVNDYFGHRQTKNSVFVLF